MRVQSLHLAAVILLLLLVGAGLALGAAAAVGGAPAPAQDTGDDGDDGDDGNVSLFVVPDDVDDPGGAAAAVADGDAEPAGKLVVDDRLAVVVDSERLAEDLEARNGSTTERFFAALAADADLRVVQTNPAPERATKLAALGPANASVHRNGTAVYVLVDTANLTFRRARSGTDEPEPVRDGERYAVTFGYGLEKFASGGPEVELYTTESRFVAGPTRTYDPLPPEMLNRSVHVNIEPESGIVARLTLEDGRNLTAHGRAEERKDRRRVTFDLRDVEPGTDYVLQLVHDGDVVDRYEGTVRDPSAAVADVNVTEVDNWTAVNATATLSHGGEVRVFNEAGERLGWTAVPPGEETDVSIKLRGSADELVVRAAREQGAGAGYYADAGTTIDFGDRQLRDPLATPTPTTEPTETATVTDTATPTHVDEDAPADDQPGFGIGVAGVAALLASALLARRRR